MTSDNPSLLALPLCVLSSHVSCYLAPIERKALRGVCQSSRLAVNNDVQVARVNGSHMARSPLTLRQVTASFPHVSNLVLADAVQEHVCGAVLSNFLDDHNVNDEPAGSPLQALDLKHCHFLTASDLQYLLLNCPQLRSLSAPRWADASHLRALQPFTLISELDLGDSSCNITSITDKSLSCVPKLPALRALSLKRCVYITDAGIAHLRAETLPSLTHLDLTSTRVTGASGFASLARLRSVVLQSCRSFGDTGLAALCTAHAASLRSLQLCGTAVLPYGSSLRHLAAATGLERLDLGPSWEVDGVGMAALACCPNLAELRLGNFNLRPQHPAAPAPAPAPEPEVAWPPPLTPISAPTAAAAVAFVTPDAAAAALPSLTRLSLGGMFGQHGLQRLLPGLRRLRRLELSGLSTARDDVLGLLLRRGGAQELQELKLVSGGPDLTATGLLRLAALPALQRLTLVACPSAADDVVRQLTNAVHNAGRRLRVEVATKKAAAPPAGGTLAAAAMAAGAGDAAMGGGSGGQSWSWGGCVSDMTERAAAAAAAAVACRT